MQNRSKTGIQTITMDRAINQKISYSEANFTALYRQFATRIYRYIFARVRNHADAEDLTAQVFMAALKGIKKFDPEGNIAAWLFTIARNKVADSYRRRKPVLFLEELPDVASEEGDPLSQLMQKEQIGQLSTVLGELDAEKQELLQLRFAGELTYAEMALVVGKTEAAVKMATHRLLRQLEEMMEQDNA